MTSQYTTGELMPLWYVIESTFGVTPITPLIYAGDPNPDIKLEIDQVMNPVYQSNNRSFGTTTYGPEKYGFQAKLSNRTAVDWRTFFAFFGFGSTIGLADHLGSFSALAGRKVGSAYKFLLFNGCKLNKLVIESDLPGNPWIFTADIMAQMATASTDLYFTGLQAVTIKYGVYPTSYPGTSPPSLLGAPIECRDDSLYINLGGTGSVLFPVKKVSLTVDNHLVGQPASVTGSDGDNYQLAAGYGIDEGERDIIVEYTIAASNENYTNSKLAKESITLNMTIGTHMITLSGGVWEANDFPTWTQGLNEETGKIRFNAMSITP